MHYAKVCYLAYNLNKHSVKSYFFLHFYPCLLSDNYHYTTCFIIIINLGFFVIL